MFLLTSNSKKLCVITLDLSLSPPSMVFFQPLTPTLILRSKIPLVLMDLMMEVGLVSYLIYMQTKTIFSCFLGDCNLNHGNEKKHHLVARDLVMELFCKTCSLIT